jgi:hypothetical protein
MTIAHTLPALSHLLLNLVGMLLEWTGALLTMPIDKDTYKLAI